MNDIQDPDRIRKVAREFDDAIEKKNVDHALSFFSNRCEIEMLGIILTGKAGARKWLKWLFSSLEEISFKPVTIIVDGNIFFEEFVLKARLHNGSMVESKQSEVLFFRDYKIESLRLYYDRMDFAEAMGTGIIKKMIIRKIRNYSLGNLK